MKLLFQSLQDISSLRKSCHHLFYVLVWLIIQQIVTPLPLLKWAEYSSSAVRLEVSWWPMGQQQRGHEDRLPMHLRSSVYSLAPRYWLGIELPSAAAAPSA